MKICTKCKQEKELKHFTYRADRNTYRSECKDCLTRRMRVRRTGREELVIASGVDPDARYTSDVTKINNFKVDPKPLRCAYEYCNCVIPLTEQVTESKLRNAVRSQIKGQPDRYYCNEWCKENAELDRLKIRKCSRCDNCVNPIYNKQKGTIAAWKRLCEECAGRRDNSLSLSTIFKNEKENKFA